MAQTITYNYFIIDSFDDLLTQYKEGVNDYLIKEKLEPVEKFEGGAYYLAFYPIAQEIINIETKLNDILTQAYLFPAIANQTIYRNNAVGDRFLTELKRIYGLNGSFETTTLETAGQISLAIDFTTEYPDTEENRFEIYKFMSESLVAGLWYNGDIDKERRIYATDYNIFAGVETMKDVKIEYRVKKNTLYAVKSNQEIQNIFLNNFNARYKIGDEFSNEEYLDYDDLPFASYINLKIGSKETNIWEQAPISFSFKDKITINEVMVIDLGLENL